MRDANIRREAFRDNDDEQDSPIVMYSIALGAPLFIIACIYGAMRLFL